MPQIKKVKYKDILPGDKIISVQGWDESVYVARSTSPDTSYIYETCGLRSSTGILFRENGQGYWHAYKLVEGGGRDWDDFTDRYNIKDTDDYMVAGKREKEN